MLCKTAAAISLALCALAAHAAEAGKIIFVAGAAQAADRPVKLGDAVQEGEMMRTGKDGFIYVKTVDNGLFILRPNTTARIAFYRVDAKEPANTQVKLELLGGVARARSGDAVKLARQNFRFNTPVAAIGVRGTDFVVSTDQDVTRVAVMSGGVVVSAFEGACRPEGNGPCEGGAARELFAAQRGKLLQVQRGKAAPELMQGGPLSPDEVAPPRADEPLVKAGAAPVLDLDVQKNGSLQVVAQVDPPGESVTPPIVMPPPVLPEPPVTETPETPTPPVPPVVSNEPASKAVWGRWQPLLGKLPTINFKKEAAKSELIATMGNYVLFRSEGKDYVVPERGNIAFKLNGGEAFIYTDYGQQRIEEAATVKSGKLNVDFDTRRFTTNLDVANRKESFKLQGGGSISRDGRMFGDEANGRVGVMEVKGLLSNDGGGSAAYLFNSRLDEHRTVNGGTSWRK